MERQGFGFIIIAAVAVLIGVALFSGTFSESMGTLTQIATSPSNFSFVAGTNGTATEITGCGQAVRTITVWNGTNNVVATTNYTASTGTGADGYQSAFLTNNNAAYNGVTWKVTCTHEPRGYVNDGATRGVINLIAIMFALLIVTAAMPDVREWIKDKMFG